MRKKTKYSTRAMLCALALIGSTMLSVSPVFAEEIEEFALDEIVVTANRVPTKAGETAANVTVITAEQIEKGHYNNVGQILEHIPGIVMVNKGSLGSTSVPYINGSEQVLLMIDGRRMNLPNGVGGFGMATANLSSFVSIDNIERIEIVKGGKSALYGADAVGGVINIITKQGEQNQTTVQASGGNWDSYGYSLANQGKDGNTGWLFTASKKHTGNYVDGNGNKYNYTAIDQDAYTLRLDQKLSGGNLSFAYEHLNDEAELKSAVQFDNIKQHNWDITYNSDNSKNIDYTVKVYQNANHRFGNTDDYFDHDVRIKGFNYQINSKISDGHILTSGIDWRKDEIESSIYGKKDNTVKAVYLQDRWEINDKLTLTPGVRYDKNDIYKDKTTPSIALNYKQNQRTTYYTSWGKVFQSPRMDDLYWPHQTYPAWGNPGDPDYYPPSTYDGNPNLKPETGWNAEIGMHHKFDKTLEGKISYFTRHLDDAIQWKNIGTYDNQYWTPSNVDKQKAHGIEVQLNKQLTSELKTFVGYNYLNLKNKTQYDNDFVKDINAPDKTWNVGMSYTIDKVSADIKGTAVMGRTNPSFKEKSYWLWDANLNVKLDKDYTAYLTVNNIFDKFYERSAGYPCSGRNYLFGVKATF